MRVRVTWVGVREWMRDVMKSEMKVNANYTEWKRFRNVWNRMRNE